MGRRPKGEIDSDNDSKNQLAFVGGNIRTLRKARGMTIDELAEKVGIQSGPMGRIERSLNSPSARVLYKLSKTLNFSIDLLFSESEELLQRRKAVEIMGAELVDLTGTVVFGKKTLGKITTYLNSERRLDASLGVQPILSLPLRLPISLEGEGIARLAQKVRSMMGLDENVLGVDWVQTLEGLGFRTVHLPFAENADAALYFDWKRQQAFFILNAARPRERQTFEMARSLGALYLRLNVLNGDQSLTRVEISKISAALDAFAMESLLPESAARMIVRQIGLSENAWTYDLLLRLKQCVGIPAEQFLWRLEDLDLIGRKPAMAIRERLNAFHAKIGSGEPASLSYTRQPNGALWDKLAVLAAIGKEQEAQAIADEFDKISLARR